MTNKEIKETLEEWGYENDFPLTEKENGEAFIGTSHDDRAVYLLSKCKDNLVEADYENVIIVDDWKETPSNYDDLCKKLCDKGYDSVILFDSPDYADAFIGLSQDDRAVYSYEKMTEHFMAANGATDEEAREFIDYNTIRAIPYFGGSAPIVVNTFYWENQ